jgi:hypothetical protein
MDDRILSPLYIPALLAAALAVDRAVSAGGRRRIVVAPAILLAGVLAAASVVRAAPCLIAMRRQGREYSGAGWRGSALAFCAPSIPRPRSTPTSIPPSGCCAPASAAASPPKPTFAAAARIRDIATRRGCAARSRATAA